MPGVTATGSTTIAVLDSKIIADLCGGKFYVDVTPSIYIGSGKSLVLGANVQITNPFGVVVKPYGTNYEIAPALSGGMDAAVSFNIPTQASNYQYGQYTVDVQMYDDAGNVFTVTKTVKICEPDKNNKSKKYGSISAQLKGVCKDGKVYFILDGVPNYNGKVVESQVNTLTIDYPTASGLSPLNTSLGYLSLALYEGVYKVSGDVCATYNMGDNIYIKVKYVVKREKDIKCIIDECCVMAKLAELHQQLKTDCTQDEKDETASIVVDALRLLKTAQLAAECGEDPSEYVDDLEKLLGCRCTCNCNEGTPLIPTDPSKDFVIEGCNVTKESVGLTDTYTIENYEYTVAITPNGGIIVISDPTLSDCTKIQTITFDISKAYDQIKTLANASNGEADFWASIINKSLRDLNPSCLGLTTLQWNNKTFLEKVKAITDKLCSCCGSCGAGITVTSVTRHGKDVTVCFTFETATYQIDLYLDGVFKGSIMTSLIGTDNPCFTFTGAADGEEHTFSIISKCSDGSVGETYTDEFIFLGCADVAMPVVTSDNVTSATCPYDLTSLEGAQPLGTTVEWHSSNSPSADTLLANPESAVSGVYYLFAKNADGCYSSGKKVTLICSVEESCSAPQSLKVNKIAGSFIVSFNSAAFPPPGNSYTVKRKAFADPDVDGSYTTIGTPVYNIVDGKWQIEDDTAIDNTLYTYKAQSNCGGSPATTPYVLANFVNINCVLGITPGINSTSIDYSFTPIGGDVDKYEVKIYDSTGVTLIKTDTHLPAFPNPITGTFNYLTPLTDYVIKIVIWVGDYSRTCELGTYTTSSDT